MASYRLLTIEDNQDIANVICRVAAEQGFDTRSANGVNAVDMYKEFRPQVIVLDLLMPGMDGFEFLQFLKRLGSRVHIVILSGGSNAHRKIAGNIGADDSLVIEACMAKPCRVGEIRAILEKIKASALVHKGVEQEAGPSQATRISEQTGVASNRLKQAALPAHESPLPKAARLDNRH